MKLKLPHVNLKFLLPIAGVSLLGVLFGIEKFLFKTPTSTGIQATLNQTPVSISALNAYSIDGLTTSPVATPDQIARLLVPGTKFCGLYDNYHGHQHLSDGRTQIYYTLYSLKAPTGEVATSIGSRISTTGHWIGSNWARGSRIGGTIGRLNSDGSIHISDLEWCEGESQMPELERGSYLAGNYSEHYRDNFGRLIVVLGDYAIYDNATKQRELVRSGYQIEVRIDPRWRGDNFDEIGGLGGVVGGFDPDGIPELKWFGRALDR